MAGAGKIQFLDRNVPRHAIADVREFVSSHYGLDGEYRPLPSERDQNFLVESVDGSRHVVKIANIDESAEVVDFHLGALEHLAHSDPSLPVPRVATGQDGADCYEVAFPGGDTHILFMLGWLPGVPMAESVDTPTPAAQRRLGAFMARVDKALRGYFHPAAEQRHPWNIATCTRLQPLTVHIADDTGRNAVDSVFRHMSDVVVPRLRTLRHQVIHQDAHIDNVLVDPGGTGEITGLIDFGDMLYGTLPAEIAVACDGIPVDAEDIITPACNIAAGFDSVLPLEEDELAMIYDLVCARAALTATIVAARGAQTEQSTAHISSPQESIDRLQQWQRVGRDEFNRRLKMACRFPVDCPTSADDALPAATERSLVAARHSLMGRRATHFYYRPMHFERGSGPWLYATDGHRYLDCYNNVPQVGHCNPHVVKAIARQAAALNTNTRYLYSSALEYAGRLTARLAPHLTACIFVNSGSEANDVAWQMAKLVTGNSGALIMEDAYHGVTDVIRQFSPGRPDALLPDFLRGLIVPDPYRGPYRDVDEDFVDRYASDADRAIAELDASGHGTAAFMVDSAFCSSGVPDVPDGYLRAVEEKVRSAGGLMICDEVQSGFGRMGQWWGHEHHGIHADIVTMGKPVGNGHPLGVVVTTDDILNRFIDATRLFSTFGGNTVACAAGNAVLDVIERDGLIERGKATGDYLRSKLVALGEKHPLIGNVRGHGMLTGLEFVSDRESRTPATTETAQLLEMMRGNRVLVGSEGRDANILKLRPALVFENEHVDFFIDALDKSLEALRVSA